MKKATLSIGIPLLSLALLAPGALADKRANEAIDRCINQASEEYGIEPARARFWQLSQTGRYVRVWLKLRTAEPERVHTVCKVHKTRKDQKPQLNEL